MFITFEGIEGSGKSTQLDLLSKYLEERGENPLCTREPGGSQLGRQLRAMLLDCRQSAIDARAELCLFLADRAQHVAENIRPALEAGRPVLCDRYSDSTLAYQGFGRGMEIAILRTLNEFATGALAPDATLLLDLPPQQGLARAGRRNRADGTMISEGRFEAESMDFHERVRQGYLDLARAEPGRIKVINAAQDPEAVFADCIAALGLRSCLKTDSKAGFSIRRAAINGVNEPKTTFFGA